MNLIRTSAPLALPVTPDEAWSHLRAILEGDGESPETEEPRDADYIAGLIDTATAWFDGYSGKLGRALITQSWEMRLPAFPAGPIEVPLPPLQSVDSVEYIDLVGDPQTLSTDDYGVANVGSGVKGSIYLLPGKQWPRTRAVPEAVTVTFTAGFGDEPTDVPAPIRHGIKMMVSHLYEHPDAVITGTVPREMLLGMQDMLSAYRVWP